MNLRETAVALGISEPTARTHLQKLLQKTGTSRQAALIRLAMTALTPAGTYSPAWICSRNALTGAQ